MVQSAAKSHHFQASPASLSSLCTHSCRLFSSTTWAHPSASAFDFCRRQQSAQVQAMAKKALLFLPLIPLYHMCR